MASIFDVLMGTTEKAPAQTPKKRGYRGPGNGRGMDNTRAILTDEQVLSIYHDTRRGKLRRECAAQYGVSVQTIRSIQNGFTWKYVTGHRRSSE